MCVSSAHDLLIKNKKFRIGFAAKTQEKAYRFKSDANFVINNRALWGHNTV